MSKKSNNQPNSTQNPLFPLPDPQGNRQKVGWFYITRKGGTEMYQGMDPWGRGVWVEHDLTRNIPHIFNSLSVAQTISRNFPGSEIRKCWYTKIAGWEIPR